MNIGLASGHVVEVELTWGTFCSGSKVVLLVLQAIRGIYAKHGIKITLIHKLSREKKKPVQKWIEGLFSELEVESGCLFESAEEMGEEFAKCVKHGGPNGTGGRAHYVNTRTDALRKAQDSRSEAG